MASRTNATSRRVVELLVAVFLGWTLRGLLDKERNKLYMCSRDSQQQQTLDNAYGITSQLNIIYASNISNTSSPKASSNISFTKPESNTSPLKATSNISEATNLSNISYHKAPSIISSVKIQKNVYSHEISSNNPSTIFSNSTVLKVLSNSSSLKAPSIISSSKVSSNNPSPKISSIISSPKLVNRLSSPKFPNIISSYNITSIISSPKISSNMPSPNNPIIISSPKIPSEILNSPKVPYSIPSPKIPSNIHLPNVPSNTPSFKVQSNIPSPEVPGGIPSQNILSNVHSPNAPSNTPSPKIPSIVSPSNSPSNIPSHTVSSNIPSLEVQSNIPSPMISNNFPSPKVPNNIPSTKVPSNTPSFKVPSNIPSPQVPSSIPSQKISSSIFFLNAPSNIPSPNILSNTLSPKILSIISSTNAPSNIPSPEVQSNIPSPMISNNIHSSTVPSNIPSPKVPSNTPSFKVPSSIPSPQVPSSIPSQKISSNIFFLNAPSNIPSPEVQSNIPSPMISNNIPSPEVPSNIPSPKVPSNFPLPKIPDIASFNAPSNIKLHSLKFPSFISSPQDSRDSFPKLPSFSSSIKKNKSRKKKKKHSKKSSLLSTSPIPEFVCPEKAIEVTRNRHQVRKVIVDPACADQYKQTIAKLVTVLINPVELPARDNMNSLLVTGLQQAYPGINIKWAVKEDAEPPPKLPYVQTVYVPAYSSSAQTWNHLVSDVQTQFVLIAHHVTQLDSDINLERLVREMYLLTTPIVGGAVRESRTGHWHHGCRQMAHRNFVGVYRHGYKQSVHDCLVCDSLTSPFIASTTYLQSHAFDASHLPERLMFEKFFFDLFKNKQKVVVCPDSMFDVHHELTKELTTEQWLPFARTIPLSRIVIQTFDSRKVHKYTCSQVDIDEQRAPGKVSAPCELESLTKHIKTVLKLCEEINILCDLVAGSMLGALKFNGVLPWERDADINIPLSNFTAAMELAPGLQEAGYTFVDFGPHPDFGWGCYESLGSGWTIGLNSMEWVHSKEARERGQLPTKINFNGAWVNAETRNVGREARNSYGPEVYKHLEHSSWVPNTADSGTYNECPNPGSHFCLDQFPKDGNLNFQDPIP